MDKIMERIKDRIVEKDSPIKSLKALAEAIGMSEGGFYLMFKKGTMKLKTKQSICEALGVDEEYFNPTKEKSEQGSSFGEDVLQKLNREMHEMRQSFEEQLKTKDRQIEKLIDLLGKPEGATVEPTLSEYATFKGKLEIYTMLVAEHMGILLPALPTLTLFDAVPDVKLVAPRSQTARTRR